MSDWSALFVLPKMLPPHQRAMSALITHRWSSVGRVCTLIRALDGGERACEVWWRPLSPQQGRRNNTGAAYPLATQWRKPVIDFFSLSFYFSRGSFAEEKKRKKQHAAVISGEGSSQEVEPLRQTVESSCSLPCLAAMLLICRCSENESSGKSSQSEDRKATSASRQAACK